MSTMIFPVAGVPISLAQRLGAMLQTVNGIGTIQSGAGQIGPSLMNLLSPSASNTAFILASNTAVGMPVFCWNLSGSANISVFPPVGHSINNAGANAAFTMAPGEEAVFQLLSSDTGVPTRWQAFLQGTVDMLTVDDGSTTVSSVTDITFTGATVSEIASGHAEVAVSGGGGAAIEPETGPAIKISAFPAASLPMGSGDVVTGLQGGANVNFDQTQLLSGQDAASPGVGQSVYAQAGAGNGNNVGGNWNITGGTGGGGDIGTYGGNVNINGGLGGPVYGYGGSLHLYGGSAPTTNGGRVRVGGGAVTTGSPGTPAIIEMTGAFASGRGGDMQIISGNGVGGGQYAGSVFIIIGNGSSGATNGNFILSGIPTSSAGLPSGAVWSNLNILTIVP